MQSSGCERDATGVEGIEHFGVDMRELSEFCERIRMFIRMLPVAILSESRTIYSLSKGLGSQFLFLCSAYLQYVAPIFSRNHFSPKIIFQVNTQQQVPFKFTLL